MTFVKKLNPNVLENDYLDCIDTKVRTLNEENSVCHASPRTVKIIIARPVKDHKYEMHYHKRYHELQLNGKMGKTPTPLGMNMDNISYSFQSSAASSASE